MRFWTELGSAGSWVMNTQLPPLAFFLTVVVVVVGVERMEMRPEQELVVK